LNAGTKPERRAAPSISPLGEDFEEEEEEEEEDEEEEARPPRPAQKAARVPLHVSRQVRAASVSVLTPQGIGSPAVSKASWKPIPRAGRRSSRLRRPREIVKPTPTCRDAVRTRARAGIKSSRVIGLADDIAAR